MAKPNGEFDSLDELEKAHVSVRDECRRQHTQILRLQAELADLERKELSLREQRIRWMECSLESLRTAR